MLPNTSSEKSTTKELIISVLGETWPLSAKKIYSKISRDTGVSYQAVHKVLNELADKGLIEKINSEYTLNTEWIEKQRKIFDTLEQKYKKGLHNTSHNSKSFTFDTVYESDRFLFDFISGQIQENQRSNLTMQWCHYWFPLFISKKEYSMLKSLANFFDVYSVVKEDTAIDRWCAEFFRNNNVKAKTGCDCAATVDLLSVNKQLVEVFYPLEIKEDLDNAYSNAKNISEIDLDQLFERVFEKKCKISIVVNKNEELASEIEKQTLKYFNPI